MKRIKRIVYATDFSPASGRAFTSAIALARSLKARLAIVHVMPELLPMVPEQYFGNDVYDQIERDERNWSRRRLDAVGVRARKFGIHAKTLLLKGDAASKIAQAAKKARADLVVVGTHGRRAIPRFFLGSVADRVVRTAPCAVLTVRGK